ncbi:hypothetical protein DENSPDRAFT_885910 [Dentipellis sp. KUC8613]|nr:hypothetical protein DENSPDRAFT_885910 [Dentipellis sp. KUC8613]
MFATRHVVSCCDAPSDPAALSLRAIWPSRAPPLPSAPAAKLSRIVPRCLAHHPCRPVHHQHHPAPCAPPPGVLCALRPAVCAPPTLSVPTSTRTLPPTICALPPAVYTPHSAVSRGAAPP